MFEICALLARKKTTKARKPAAPPIKVGAKVQVYGREGIVTKKHDTTKGWWMVEVEGRESGFDRSAIKVI